MVGEDGKFKGRDPAYVYDKSFVLKIAAIALVCALAITVVLVVNFGYDLVEKRRRTDPGLAVYPEAGPVTLLAVAGHPKVTEIQVRDYDPSVPIHIANLGTLGDGKLCDEPLPPTDLRNIVAQCYDVTVVKTWVP